MNEQHFQKGIRAHLDRGLENLPAGLQTRLAAARQEALKHHRQTHRRLDVLFGHGWLRPALATLLLAVTVGLTTFYIRGQEEISAMAAVDVDLLTDDLPPKAYTDPGFRAWLESSSEG